MRRKFPLWPGLLSVDFAAMYCSMNVTEFRKAVAGGELPQPVLIDGKERWSLADIEGQFESTEKWEMSNILKLTLAPIPAFQRFSAIASGKSCVAGVVRAEGMENE